MSSDETRGNSGVAPDRAAEMHANHAVALHEHMVGGDLGHAAAREPDHEDARVPRHAAARPVEHITADGVVHHVGAKSPPSGV